MLLQLQLHLYLSLFLVLEVELESLLRVTKSLVAQKSVLEVVDATKRAQSHHCPFQSQEDLPKSIVGTQGNCTTFRIYNIYIYFFFFVKMRNWIRSN